MKTLFIDTHMYDINIILFNNDQIIKQRHIDHEKHNSTLLMPSIASICENDDFDQILVVNGPGSFTGVRLGVTVAKTLAYTMSKSIKQLTYFDLMNFSSDSKYHIFAISDYNGYFVAEFKNHVKQKEFNYVNNSDFEILKQNCEIETDVAIDYKAVLEAAMSIDNVNPHDVKPIYVKSIGIDNDRTSN